MARATLELWKDLNHWKEVPHSNAVARAFTKMRREADLVAQGRELACYFLGPPGVGKTLVVEEALAAVNRPVIRKNPRNYVELAQAFHEAGDEKAIILDECDQIFRSDRTLKLLNEATNRHGARWFGQRWEEEVWDTAAEKMVKIRHDGVNLRAPLFVMTNLRPAELPKECKPLFNRNPEIVIPDDDREAMIEWTVYLALAGRLLGTDFAGRKFPMTTRVSAIKWFVARRHRIDNLGPRTLRRVCEWFHDRGPAEGAERAASFYADDRADQAIDDSPQPDWRKLRFALESRLPQPRRGGSTSRTRVTKNESGGAAPSHPRAALTPRDDRPEKTVPKPALFTRDETVGHRMDPGTTTKQSATSDKSPIRFVGGKSRAAAIILEYIPPSASIVSPFLGGGSVEIALAASGVKVVGYDILEPLTCFWHYLLADPELLCREIMKLYPLSKDQFATIKAALPTMEVSLEKAVMYYVINRASFSGAALSGGMSARHDRFTRRGIQSLANFRAPNLSVFNADFRDSIVSHPREFLYLDPPYRLARGKNVLYGVNGSTHKDFDHKSLFSLLKNRGRWLMSYNDDARITSLYKGFPMVEVSWTYSMPATKRSNEILIGSRDLIGHMQRVARKRGERYRALRRPPVKP